MVEYDPTRAPGDAECPIVLSDSEDENIKLLSTRAASVSLKPSVHQLASHPAPGKVPAGKDPELWHAVNAFLQSRNSQPLAQSAVQTGIAQPHVQQTYQARIPQPQAQPAFQRRFTQPQAEAIFYQAPSWNFQALPAHAVNPPHQPHMQQASNQFGQPNMEQSNPQVAPQTIPCQAPVQTAPPASTATIQRPIAKPKSRKAKQPKKKLLQPIAPAPGPAQFAIPGPSLTHFAAPAPGAARFALPVSYPPQFAVPAPSPAQFAARDELYANASRSQRSYMDVFSQLKTLEATPVTNSYQASMSLMVSTKLREIEEGFQAGVQQHIDDEKEMLAELKVFYLEMLHKFFKRAMDPTPPQEEQARRRQMLESWIAIDNLLGIDEKAAAEEGREVVTDYEALYDEIQDLESLKPVCRNGEYPSMATVWQGELTGGTPLPDDVAYLKRSGFVHPGIPGLRPAPY